MFDRLVKINNYSKNKVMKKIAKNILEKLYCCEINCIEIDKSTKFAHHARGCTIIASKICENTVIFQNVTVGSNLRYNKEKGEWENLGNPIIDKNTVICDGAKILGPVIVGENSVIAAGAIVTKDIPSNSIVCGVNKFRERDISYDIAYNSNMVDYIRLIETNKRLIKNFEANILKKNIDGNY